MTDCGVAILAHSRLIVFESRSDGCGRKSPVSRAKAIVKNSLTLDLIPHMICAVNPSWNLCEEHLCQCISFVNQCIIREAWKVRTRTLSFQPSSSQSRLRWGRLIHVTTLRPTNRFKFCFALLCRHSCQLFWSFNNSTFKVTSFGYVIVIQDHD